MQVSGRSYSTTSFYKRLRSEIVMEIMGKHPVFATMSWQQGCGCWAVLALGTFLQTSLLGWYF